MSTERLSGAAIANEIYALIKQNSDDMVRENRQSARAAADAELEYGLEEAAAMREQADDMLTGAYVGGGLRMASGVGQSAMAAETASETSLPDGYSDMATHEKQLALSEIQNATKWHGAATDSFGQLGGVAGNVDSAYGSSVRRHEAEAATARARGRAEGHRVEDAQSRVDEASKSRESAKDLLRSVRDTQHEATMAAINVRG